MRAPDGRRAPRPGFRLQWEAQGCHVLLYPEGMVKLNRSAGEILTRCTGSRDIAEIVVDLEPPSADRPAGRRRGPSRWRCQQRRVELAPTAMSAPNAPAARHLSSAPAVAAGRAHLPLPAALRVLLQPGRLRPDRRADELSTADWLRVLREAARWAPCSAAFRRRAADARRSGAPDRRGAPAGLLHQPAHLRRRPHEEARAAPEGRRPRPRPAPSRTRPARSTTSSPHPHLPAQRGSARPSRRSAGRW